MTDPHPTRFPALHPSILSIEQLMSECELLQTKRGGPGGQHRNKTESAIVITHLPTGCLGQASERRSQHQNRDAAIERLRLAMALAVPFQVDPQQSPSYRWRARTVNQRLQCNSKHFDFAALLSEAIGFLRAESFEPAAAAQRLGVSTSQLVKFLKLQPAAMVLVNEQRQQSGKHPLR